MGDDDLKKLPVIDALPCSRWPPSKERGIFSKLAGATILRMGGTTEDIFEGGGLILDYRPLNSEQVHRIVFAFNENAMWCEGEVILGKDEASFSTRV